MNKKAARRGGGTPAPGGRRGWKTPNVHSSEDGTAFGCGGPSAYPRGASATSYPAPLRFRDRAAAGRAGRVNPEDELGAASAVHALASLATEVAEAVRDDYAERRSTWRTVLHPGVLVLSALLSLVCACIWAGSSPSLGSVVPFLLSTALAAAAALSLELRRGRLEVGIFASLAVAVCWFLLGGFVYATLLFGRGI